MSAIEVITTALVAGAAVAVTDTANQIVKDAYRGFKTLLVSKFGAGVAAAATIAEQMPNTEATKAVVQASLTLAQAHADEEVLALAKALIVELEKVGLQPNAETRNMASNIGGGAIAQGDNARAAGQSGVIVDGDVQGSINTGNINTGGGAFIGGNADLGGGSFVGRDHNVTNNYYGPSPTESASTQFSDTGHKLYAILKDKWFSESDLQDLCFQLDIDWDALNGGNKIDKARSLVLDCEKNNKLPKLLSIVRLARPNLQDRLPSSQNDKRG